MDRSESVVELPQRPADDDIALLDENLRIIGDRSDAFVSHFYATLFLDNPQLRELFGESMDVQRDRFFRALTDAVRNIGSVELFVPMLEQLGSDHRKYGVRAEHYTTFGEALIASLAKFSADVWVPELEDAWARAYGYLAATMVEGARKAAAEEPAWWRAQIVSHERRADDIAVLMVRTDRPYGFRAGQYASIETPYRPRSWRTYSMATGQGPDGLVEFHVRAVGGGFVSGPLVWRAQVGDELKLGPPRGDMAIDQHSQRDLLCIAGGTGLAPIKAMIDEMSRWNTARSVTLFLGGRRADDLYDIDALHRIAGLNPWLTIVPCVSEETAWGAERGNLPDLVARRGVWVDHDVIVCGSPSMMRATLARLRDLGVPENRISYDQPADPQPVTAEVIDLRRPRTSRANRTSRARR